MFFWVFKNLLKNIISQFQITLFSCSGAHFTATKHSPEISIPIWICSFQSAPLQRAHKLLWRFVPSFQLCAPSTRSTQNICDVVSYAWFSRLAPDEEEPTLLVPRATPFSSMASPSHRMRIDQVILYFPFSNPKRRRSLPHYHRTSLQIRITSQN